MILEMFLVLIAIAIFCMWWGEKTNELTWTIVGCFIFFILGSWVIFGKYTGYDLSGLQYQTGVFLNQTSATETMATNIYTSYDDKTTFWVGLFLSIMGALGWILAGIAPRRKKE
jgi:hypothetical protein